MTVSSNRMISTRIIATVVGALVGTLLGLVAASGGHVSAAVVVLLAFVGGVFGFADCCWRQPPRTSAH